MGCVYAASDKSAFIRGIPIAPSRVMANFTHRTGRHLILIVEDHDDLLGLLTAIVTKEGWVVVGVESGKDALGAFSPGKFAMALVDVGLGDDMDGIEISKKFRSLDPSLHIVMTSGRPRDQERVEQIGLGDFLVKPFLPPQIVALLQSRG